MMSQTRIALLAAIFLGAVTVASFARQAMAFVSLGASTYSYAPGLLMRFVLSLALPAMLAVWFWSGAAITPGAALRRWALGAAVVLGVFFTALPLLGWSEAMVRGSSALGWLGATAKSGAQRWLNPTLLPLLHYCSNLIVVLLLITLTRRPEGAVRERTGGTELLRTLALAATIQPAVAIVQDAMQFVSTAGRLAGLDGQMLMDSGRMESIPTLTPLLIALSIVVNSLPHLCRLSVPIIVFRAISAQACCDASS